MLSVSLWVPLVYLDNPSWRFWSSLLRCSLSFSAVILHTLKNEEKYFYSRIPHDQTHENSFCSQRIFLVFLVLKFLSSLKFLFSFLTNLSLSWVWMLSLLFPCHFFNLFWYEIRSCSFSTPNTRKYTQKEKEEETLTKNGLPSLLYILDLPSSSSLVPYSASVFDSCFLFLLSSNPFLSMTFHCFHLRCIL